MSDETTDRPSNVVPLRVLEGGGGKPARALTDKHREHLRTSGLNDESIALGGFWSASSTREISKCLGRPWKRPGGALMLPFVMPGSDDEVFVRARPDEPRLELRKDKTPVVGKDGKVKTIKYEQPTHEGALPFAPYFPARTRASGWLADTGRDLLLVEGEKKAALLDQLGYATIGSTGVDCFHDKPYREATGLWRFHELILKHVALAGRRVLIVFDSDAASNEDVMTAARRVTAMCDAAGAKEALLVRIPEDGPKKYGIDDYFVAFGEVATRNVIEQRRERLVPLVNDESAFTVTKHKALGGIPVDDAVRIPRGYSIDKDGRLTEAGGSEDVIERSGIFIRRIVSDLYSGAENVELVFRRAGTWRTVCVPRRSIVDSRQLVAEMGPVGGPVDTNTASKVVTWLRDFEAENEKRLPHATSVGRCGWHRVGEHTIFVLGAEMLTREGASPDVVVERGADRARLWRGLHVSGEYEAHLEALRAAWAASPVCAAAICASLAAPLLKPLAAPLFAVHLAGDSSRGKSSMLKIAASVYGAPQDEEWVTSWNATSVGHEVRASLLSDLPLCVDEAGVVDARDRERAVYMLINGVGRVRGAREGGLREGHSWRTVVLSTGERMLAEQDSATGAQVRVLQWLVSGFGNLDAAGVDGLRRACEEHHGQVGLEWLGALLETTDEAWVAHRQALRERERVMQSRAKDSLRARQAGFFALLAHVESIAHDVLGLGRQGGATMHELFLRPGDAGIVVRTAAERAIDAVREWIVRSPRAFPRLELEASGARVPKWDGPPGDVCGYVDVARHELLLVPGALRTHLSERGIDDTIVIREWHAKGLLDADKGHATKVVRVAGKRMRVVVVRGDHAGLDAPSEEFGGDA